MNRANIIIGNDPPGIRNGLYRISDLGMIVRTIIVVVKVAAFFIIRWIDIDKCFLGERICSGRLPGIR